MKSYGRNRLPKAPPRRRVPRLEQPRTSSLERTRGLVREHGERERPFDPGQRSSWRSRPGELVINRGRMRRNTSEKDLEEFMQGYLVCMLWSSNDESDESGGEPLDSNYSLDDISDESFQEARDVCAQFLAQCGHAIESATLERQSEYDKMGAAGHDFWLTRNGHGAGFWDGDWSEPEATVLDECSKKFGEAHPYVGDDGKVHIDDGYLIRGRMKPNASPGDSVPYHLEPANFRYHDAPDKNGRRVRWSDFQHGTADEGPQWYSVGGNVGGGTTVGKSNYNSLEAMLEEKHPSNSDPVVWGDIQGDGFVVLWDQLDESIQEALGALDEYPLIDDSEHSKLENEAQEEAWENWGRSEFEKELLSSLNAEFTNDSDEIDDLDEIVGSGDVYELFGMGCNVSNEYWQEESDGGMFIRMSRVADAVVEVIMGRDKNSWVDPDAKQIVEGIRGELGIKVK